MKKKLDIIILVSLVLLISVSVNADQIKKSSVTNTLNSWTTRPFLNNPMDFQFAIVSDRTGGHRPDVFSNAMHKINLLQPEFVMCVGDLIEGATTNIDVLNKEFNEMDSFLNSLNMRFFRTPGNHDIGNNTMLDVYKKRYGSPYYHFIYKDVLFLIISTEDPPVTKITNEQVKYVEKVLKDNKNVRWTVVFMHQPMFQDDYKDRNGNWPKIENMLKDRPHNLFCGHYHGYKKTVKNGHTYIRMATTGGGSSLSGIKHSAFDHFIWVTMTDQGPLIANIMLDGIHDENINFNKK